MSKATDEFRRELDRVTPALIDRADGRCELRIPGACLSPEDGYCWQMSRHHRLPRGNGGTNDIRNLLFICGDGVAGCHGYVESKRDEAYRKGWLVRQGILQPEDVPVLLPSGQILVLAPEASYGCLNLDGEAR